VNRSLRSLRLVALFAPIAGLAAIGGACSSRPKNASDENREEFVGETRETEIKHEACDPSGKAVKTFKADDPLSPAHSYVTHVYDGSREICWFADLNGDGRVDVYTFFGDDGAVRRRESSYSIAKPIDEIALYKGGQIEIVMRDTSFDGALDTWDYYEAGKLVRRERDKTGEGRIDEWWTFQPGTENATIVQADPRTGKPDPTQKLEINVSFAAGPAAPMSAPISTVVPKAAAKEAGVEPGGAPTSTSPNGDAAPPPSSGADAGKKDAK
jgi:hypothetical protein